MPNHQTLSNAAIKAAKPKIKQQKLSDGRGLYLYITPRGGKWWRFRYRYDGKEKLLSLGTYPDVSLAQARERREAARKQVADGIDPSAAKKAAKAAKVEVDENTFEKIAREWHLLHEANWVPSHATRIIRRLQRDIFPWLGSQPIKSIKAPDILSVARQIEDRGAIETAHRAVSNIGQVMRYAVATGRAERDPTPDLRGALRPAKGKHLAAVTKPEKVGELLRTIYGYEGSHIVMYALRLAPLVFVRPGELRQAQWADIDLDAAEWCYLVTKTNTDHIVPLARQAVEIFRQIQPITSHGRYVFPSARTPRGDRPMSDNAILAAMRRMGIAKDEMSGHGWRAVARTLLDEVLKFRPDYIEHQLAHAVRDPLGRAYNRTKHLDERGKMMQAWADYLDGLRN